MSCFLNFFRSRLIFPIIVFHDGAGSSVVESNYNHRFRVIQFGSEHIFPGCSVRTRVPVLYKPKVIIVLEQCFSSQVGVISSLPAGCIIIAIKQWACPSKQYAAFQGSSGAAGNSTPVGTQAICQAACHGLNQDQNRSARYIQMICYGEW